MSTPISSSTSTGTTPIGGTGNASTGSSGQPVISFGGLVSGLNTQQIVQALLQGYQAPIIQMQNQQAQEQAKLAAWNDLNTKLGALQSASDSLKLQANITAKSLTFAGPAGTFATGTATATATNGSFSLMIDQLATATNVTSTSGIGQAIVGADAVTSNAVLSTPVTVGSFTVSGHSVSVTTGETFSQVLTDIGTQTGGAVTATLTNNTIQLTSNNGQPITLGSGGDSSNFLTVSKLLGQPSALTIGSSGPVGVADANAILDNAHLNALTSTPTGSLVVNGVTINYDTTKDSLNTVLGRINASAAGVTATYNANSDTVSFTAGTTGNVDISIGDGAGNLFSNLNVITRTTSTNNIGGAIAGADDATSTSKLATDVTAGDFTVNGQTVTVNAGDTFSTILANISTATSGDVTGAVVGDTIQLTSHNGQPIALVAGTSNFLAATKLATQPSSTLMTSGGPLGVANSGVALDSANLPGLTSTTTGAFTVNGVTINYDTTTDTLTQLVSRINASGAGVTASYDSTADKVSIVANGGGNLTLSDTTGNIVSTLQLGASVTSGHQLGKSAKYEVNGGAAQFSLSNTVNNLVPGVNVTLQATTPSQVTGTVTLDSSVGTKAIQSYVDAYNAVVDTVASDTAFDSATNTAGVLFGDPNVTAIQDQLDAGLFISNGSSLGLTPPFIDVSTIGLNTGPIGSAPGSTTHLQFDSSTFQTALSQNPGAVTNLVNQVFNNLSTTINGMTQPFGLVDGAIQGETQQITDIQSEIFAQNQILQQQQDVLNQEFTNLDTELAQLQSQSSAGASVLASLGASTATSSTPSTSAS